MTTPQKIYLKDYTAPVFTVNTIDLDIRIFDGETIVDSTLNVTRQSDGDLVLLGRKLELVSISLDGQTLTADDYSLDSEQLIIKGDKVGKTAIIKTSVKIHPEQNTELEGLYTAGTGADLMYVTQCEPEGFRKITFYPDRPDVLAVFTTRVEADKKFPVLLANGNLIEKGDLEGGRHFAIWEDPTKKPSYLFACVAADLDVLTDHYTTSEGRKVLLELYAKPQDIDKCYVGMQALKDSMKWDEDNYGRAYDLDRYMIVATSQFNMGAMENKGLNIFNTSCVLSSPETTTDGASFRVKAVIAHEYFHNWTGNRVTCRDWFQLCLKEGLTVFRDQSFSADFRSPAVQRIDDVGVLRMAQFTEDAGPLAHPVRPDSFVEINNFYTATVYEKGAEICRMMANLLGKEKYRKAMDIYFDRHDGQAVTIEDFISALATQDERINLFLQWYKQPATPVLSGSYAKSDKGVSITLSQKIRTVDGFEPPKNLPIPVATAIFDKQTGELLVEDLPLLTDSEQTFELAVPAGREVLVSVLRSFSAPVILNFDYTDEELALLVKFETDGFNRWQAIQTLINRYLAGADNLALIADALGSAVDGLIGQDDMLASRLFDVPGEKEIGSGIEKDYDPALVKARRDELKQDIAKALADKALAWYQALPMVAYEDTPKADGVRALRNVVLGLIASNDKAKANELATAQYANASCMSERMGALSAMVHYDLADKASHLQAFYDKFKDEALVVDAWFSVQAAASSAGVDEISRLMASELYDWGTPNRVRAVLNQVANRPVLLWSEEGLALYLSALLKLDTLNPQVSARSLGALSNWYTLNDSQKAIAKAKLQDFGKQATSKNVLEFVQKLLDADK